MRKIAVTGCILACLAAPANAVVVIETTAIGAHPAPADVQPSPALGHDIMAIAIPVLMFVIVLHGLGKTRSPRPVVA